jgi:23S rRNA (pseudouridine1915-N3)-methyltransferase
MPAWVNQGFDEYGKRFPRELELKLVEVTTPNKLRQQSAGERLKAEAALIRARLPKRSHVVALDEHGRSWTSTELAKQLGRWLELGSDVALLVGSADGLHADIKTDAQQSWSLSPLTLPHGMVRVVVAEQLYRAWSILHNHPYHRA